MSKSHCPSGGRASGTPTRNRTTPHAPATPDARAAQPLCGSPPAPSLGGHDRPAARGTVQRLGLLLGLSALLILVVAPTFETFTAHAAERLKTTEIGLAPKLGLPPITLCVAAAMAASMAFMLPVATPPNALVYSSGYFRIGQMARAGFLMNLLGCGVMIACLYWAADRLFGAIPVH